MAWNVKNSLIPMAQRQPRTPGEMLMNPLSREGSIVSQLSSEIMSSEGDGGDMSRRASVQQDAMRSRSRDDGTGRDARDAGRERNRSAHLWSSTRASSGNNRAMSANEGRRRSRIGSAVDTIAGVGSGSVSKARRDSEADAEDLKCASCGSTTFTAAMVKGKQRLKCKRCGSVV
jgi:ribosomal protein S27AE